MDFKLLRQVVEKLFGNRARFDLLNQEIAENFYPQRAMFTVRGELSPEFASNLSTSYPLLMHRELQDQIGTMLRPTAKAWFHITPHDEDRETHEAKRWLQWAETIQRRAMYERSTMFSRATKEADGDFAAFGQAVISLSPSWKDNNILYRTWHLSDVVWMEDETGEICLIARKWKPKRHELKRLFGDKNHPSLDQELKKDPFGEVDCLHIIIKSEMYEETNANGKPWMSIYYDKSHDKKLEEVGTWNREYCIPRWQTVSGSQYAFSPCTVAALPDARLLQAMTYTLLEAGEKVTNPPMVATQQAVRGDVAIYAGGITWVDRDYDERLGQSLRVLDQNYGGMPIGIDMQRDTRSLLLQAFYLNKLSLPERAPDMTAYEVGQRIQEYIRGALPLFEPMEHDYNGQICEMSFEMYMRMGRFGSPHDIPSELRGADINFKFESPLHDAIEQQKGQKWLESKAIIADAIALDQSVAYMIDARTALRDVLTGTGTPMKWLRSEEQVKQFEDEAKNQIAQQQLLANLEQGSNVAKNLGQAQQAIQ